MSPATILLLFLAGLVVLPWDPALIPGPLQANPAPTPADQPIDDPAFERRVFMFPCSEEQCSAWLYLPKGVERPPVVVLAHGLGAQKDFGLGTYSEAFARNGIAAFVFDYRGFGGSTGEPRHWISPQRHLEDYRSAVAYIRSNLTHVVNPDQMVLWGTSLAGGHALVTAERLGSKVVKGVIAHVPFTDGKPLFARNVAARGWVAIIRGLLGGLHDLLRGSVTYPPAYYPIAGPLGSFSFMQLTPEELEAYFAKHPMQKQGGWRNMGRARLVLEMARYRPILSIPNIKVPILFISATKDRLCRPEDVAAAAALAQHPTEVTIDANHFEIYRGQYLQQAMDAMVRHVWRCVGGSRQHPAEHAGAEGAEPDEDEQQEAGAVTSHEGEL